MNAIVYYSYIHQFSTQVHLKWAIREHLAIDWKPSLTFGMF